MAVNEASGEYGGGGDIRERLKSGKLTEDDIKKIGDLLDQSDSDGGDMGSVGGRRVVAKLPHGMDVVK